MPVASQRNQQPPKSMIAKLAHFELLEEIGKGGMATVYRAYDSSLNRNVAIKVMNEELAQEDPQFVENFLREAQNAAAISHPNIVQIYFIGEEQGKYYLVMEMLDGQSLDELLESTGPLDEATVLKIATQVTEALKAANANKLVHGDLKPQNIFITKKGDVKLLDFGLAKLASSPFMTLALYKQGEVEVEKKSDGDVWGSPYYISPERVGQIAEDFRSDIYSLGATMFHALVGHPPFEAETSEELAVMRLHEPAPPLRQLRPELSNPTAGLVAKMLAKTPAARQLNYDELLDDLREASTNLRTRSAGFQVPARTGTEQVAPPPKKSSLPLVLGSIAALLVIGGGIAFFATREAPAPVDEAPAPVDQAAAPVAPGVSTAQDAVAADGEGVLFQYTAPDASAVYLAGDFNSWANNVGGRISDPDALMQGPDANGVWRKSVELPPGTHRFKYNINGSPDGWVVPPGATLDAEGNAIITVTEEGKLAGNEKTHQVAGSNKVAFRFLAPEADTVHLAGDFNNWAENVNGVVSDPKHAMTKNAEGAWEKEVELGPGSHSYKFVVNGNEWVNDPNASGQDSEGNSIIEVK
jgi:serine/threonine protein kinase